MTERPTEEDAIRVAITEQCARKEPVAAVSLYSSATWGENFERPWVLPNDNYLRHSTEIEGGGGHIFCRSCVQPKKHGKLLAYKLHVTIEDTDPMQVQKHGIITLECHGCGFEQIVPRKPKAAGRDANGMFVDEYNQFDPQKMQAMMDRQWGYRMGAQNNAIGNALGQRNQNAPGQGLGDTTAEFLDKLRQLREHNVIDEERYKEFVAKHLEEAQRKVAAAVAAPPPIKRKGFFG